MIAASCERERGGARAERLVKFDVGAIARDELVGVGWGLWGRRIERAKLRHCKGRVQSAGSVRCVRSRVFSSALRYTGVYLLALLLQWHEDRAIEMKFSEPHHFLCCVTCHH